MKNSKKVFNSVGQNTTEVKKSQKHDANLQKNSTLYFQIGLILCLLGTYTLFEMQFQDKLITPDAVTIDEVAIIDVPPIYKVEQVQEKPKPKVERSTVIIDKIEQVDNNTPEVEKKIFTPDSPEPSPEPANPGDFEPIEKPKDPVIVDFIRIEKAPVYPGCEKYKTNEERKTCMSKKITKLINRKFNKDIGSDYGLSGIQRIYTQFTIDVKGNITDIKLRGPHPVLEKEANRVINKIPQMEPGKQRNVPVGVKYTLPIVYDARN